MKRTQLGSMALAFAMVAAPGLAHAGVIAFNESTCTSGSISSASVTCGTKVAGVDYSATFSAWSAPTSGNFGKASFTYYPSSGAGIQANGESLYGSQHAVDNFNGTDALLINFGSSNFALNQISIGWRDGDSDLSILRYTGAGAPSLGGFGVANLVTAGGWESVGDYSSLAPNKPLSFNDTGTIKTASWWLVSAYNSAYTGKPSAPDLGNYNDYFKLNSFAGNMVVVTPPPSDVPEPGTFALFGIALLGFVAARRKLRTK